MQTSTSPSRDGTTGGPAGGVVASGDIASSGSTRIADQAGRKLARNAAPTEPTTPKTTPPQLITTPATKNSWNIQLSIRTQNTPSGTPIAAPASARTIPSPMTIRPTCERNAPTARSIASV